MHNTKDQLSILNTAVRGYYHLFNFRRGTISQLRHLTILSLGILLMGLFSTSNAQVIGGSVGLYSQADVNSFAGTSIEGYLIIQGADIVDLSPLSTLTSVGHLVELNNNNSLTSLDGLSNLTSVGDRLTITNNDLLANLDGLSNLTSVGSSLEVNNNASLTSVDGLSNLTSVGWSLKINGNDLLTSLDGFDNLTSMPGDLEVNNNAALTSLSFSNITSMNTLDVQHNAALTTLSLTDLTSANWMFVTYNQTLTTLSLSNLNSIYGVTLEGNPELTNLDGLSNLTSVTLHLYVSNNGSLTNVDGLSNLTSVGGNLTISSHALLTNLDGLNNLTTVGGFLSVYSNINLNKFCGLQPLLSLTGLSGNYNVQGNLVNPTQQQIIDDGPCPATALAENELLPKDYKLRQNYPNPFNPPTTIRYALPERSNVKLTIFDIRGKEVRTLKTGIKAAGSYDVQWDSMDQNGNQVNTGVYIARLQAGDFNKTIKMVYSK